MNRAYQFETDNIILRQTARFALVEDNTEAGCYTIIDTTNGKQHDWYCGWGGDNWKEQLMKLRPGAFERACELEFGMEPTVKPTIVKTQNLFV